MQGLIKIPQRVIKSPHIRVKSDNAPLLSSKSDFQRKSWMYQPRKKFNLRSKTQITHSPVASNLCNWSLYHSLTLTRHRRWRLTQGHCNDIIMSAMVSQITGVSMVCFALCSGAHQRKHQNSASLALVRGSRRWPVNSPHKRPVTRKMFPYDDVISISSVSQKTTSLQWNNCLCTLWWRHQMETFSMLLAICAGHSPVPGEFPAQRPVTRSFDLRLNKRLSKQSWGWWFETLSSPLWRHCNVMGLYPIFCSLVCLYAQFGQVVIWIFNSLSIDKEWITVLIPR